MGGKIFEITLQNPISREEMSCPICANKVNWMEVISDKNYDGKIHLLAECWSGDSEKEADRHMFEIILVGLPIIQYTFKGEPRLKMVGED